MMLLLLKLTLAPSLAALATLVARQWGPRAGGILIGSRCRRGPSSFFWPLSMVWNSFSKPPWASLGLVGVASFALTTSWLLGEPDGSARLQPQSYVSSAFRPCSARSRGGRCRRLRLRGASHGCAGRPTTPIQSRQSVATLVDLPLRMAAAAILTLSITEVASPLAPC